VPSIIHLAGLSPSQFITFPSLRDGSETGLTRSNMFLPRPFVHFHQVFLLKCETPFIIAKPGGQPYKSS